MSASDSEQELMRAFTAAIKELCFLMQALWLWNVINSLLITGLFIWTVNR